MAANAIVDAGFLVALLRQRDAHREWAALQARLNPPPWRTCEAVLSESFHLLGLGGAPAISELLWRGELEVAFSLGDHMESVLTLMRKYADIPMSLADACLVRMTETLPDPLVMTTDADFRVYRRHSRQVVPCVLPD
jgi:predicted nucleic acid-binding protein